MVSYASPVGSINSGVFKPDRKLPCELEHGVSSVDHLHKATKVPPFLRQYNYCILLLYAFIVVFVRVLPWELSKSYDILDKTPNQECKEGLTFERGFQRYMRVSRPRSQEDQEAFIPIKLQIPLITTI